MTSSRLHILRYKRRAHGSLLARLALSFALLWQSAGLALASSADLSDYLCRETGQTSMSADAAIKDFLIAVGEWEEPAENPPHCPDCLASTPLALNVRAAALTPILRSSVAASVTPAKISLRTPRGPPLGSRAPPLSL